MTLRWSLAGEVLLRKEGAERVESGQLNIYEKWLSSVRGPVSEGDLVAIKDESGEFLGIGFYEGVGSILVRVLSRELSDPAQVVEERLRDSLSLRERLKLDNFFRWVYSEADSLPGLIVDAYDDVVVLSSTSIGMDLRIESIASMVERIYRPSSIVLRNDSRPRKEVDLPLERRIIKGSKSRAVIREGSALFHVDAMEGQKTGFFIDQRMNRLELGRLAGPGDRVLDLFSYTGGFSMHAAISGAYVTAVEESDYAVAEMRRNALLNSVNVNIVKSRVKEFLERDQELYDIVVVDPPAFAPRRDMVEIAKRTYVAVNASALSKVVPGGLIITSSCSLFISKEKFRRVIERASRRAAREVKILKELQPSPDHPFDPKHPWTLYLKGYVLQVT
ncbi:MAG: class I SAM-dependent rRNA methyltransferase [Candidatus Korarchaeum sp.]